jgi:hypothetical protein
MDEACYDCQHCGEEIIIPVDVSAGRTQSYVEDCPVCCHPHRLRIRIDRDGSISVTADSE